MIGGFLGDLSNHDWGFMGDLSNHDWGFMGDLSYHDWEFTLWFKTIFTHSIVLTRTWILIQILW
jgi:hypothetical protein